MVRGGDGRKHEEVRVRTEGEERKRQKNEGRNSKLEEESARQWRRKRGAGNVRR